MVLGDLSPEVMQPGHEPDHSISARAEGKNDWICTSHPVSLVFCVETTIHFTKILLQKQKCTKERTV